MSCIVSLSENSQVVRKVPNEKHFYSKLLFSTILICATPLFAQTDIGEPCEIDGGLRSIANIFDPALDGVFNQTPYRSFQLADITGDGTEELLVADYFQVPHYVVIADGASGDILYSLESVSPDDYWFASNAAPIGDADLDGVPDFILVSHDQFLNTTDILILSGADGHGLARIEVVLENDDSITITPSLFTDLDKSGQSDANDIYTVIASSISAQPMPTADLNMDGVVDEHDVSLAINIAGPITTSTINLIAAAVGGTVSGPDIVLLPDGTDPSYIIGWLKKIYNCAFCWWDCADAWIDAANCDTLLRQAKCDCYSDNVLDDFAISDCLADLHENFFHDCDLPPNN